MRYHRFLAIKTIISLGESTRKTSYFGHYFAKDFVDIAKAKSVNP